MTYGELGQRTGYGAGTLRNLKWVASRVAPEQRHPELSFAHHQEVVRLPPEQQDTVLAQAEAEGWTSKAVRREAYRFAAISPEPAGDAAADPAQDRQAGEEGRQGHRGRQGIGSTTTE